MQLKTYLSSRPPWSPEDRQLEHSLRIQKLRQLADFFEPTQFQLRYGLALIELLKSREEHAEREKFHTQPLEICPELIPGQRSYRATLPVSQPDRQPAQGSLLLAMPGLGKTRTTRQILNLFEQRTEREGQAPRIAWLHLHASPSNLALFCTEFLQALSEVAGDPRIRDTFLAQNASKDLGPAAVVELAKVHSLGCLVIDDVQNFLTTENGDVSKVRKLLKRLQDDADVPVVLLGTLAGAAYVEGELESALAFGGAASDVWDRLPYDRSWRQFAEALWQYQWTRTPVELSEDLSEQLYYHSQGVISLAISLYERVQRELILLGKRDIKAGNSEDFAHEIITPGFIDAIAEWCFKPVHAHLDALRSRDFAKLAAFPDLRPLPSEARKLELERKQAEGEASEKSETAPVALELGDLTDATDEEIAEHRQRITREADTLVESARLAMAAAEIITERQDEILKKVSEDLDDKIYSKPREFLVRVERQILIEERKRKKVEKRQRRTPTEEDLDTILRPGTDVLESIVGARLGLDALLAVP
ncbi:AAA family ATPase [Pelagerythrobacter aerophilus]|nr:AAA family ATPase [Pelagerythrobacter aerophilus]